MAGHLLACRIDREDLSIPAVLFSTWELSMQNFFASAQINGYRLEGGNP